VSTITGTPLLDSLFRSLSNPALFDSAVDCLVDIIHETQELDENMRVIEEIVPRLIALRPVLSLQSTKDDSDTFRGYCRIFVEAGEWYEPIIVRHQESFLPIVAAIAECSAYEDLDVVSITLNFWYRLSKRIRHSENGGSEALLNLFANLVETIIRQLHYPEQEITGQERDDFKSFRRSIGETLKDCCTVLGATTCLRRSYEIISSSLAAAVARGQEPKWQDIEAPLFSMRSMGAEVDPRENEIVPQIMDLLPQLPLHSKIRYAAILVVGRYTDWINFHPEYIQFQLPYVSAGFDSPDFEVSAAAAQTMKYLCKDCSHHLVPYLPQLHTFFKSVTNKLGPEDLLDLTAAIGHIIAVMPATEAPSALQLFCMPNIETIHSLSINPTPATKSELDSACDALARIDMLLATAGPLADGLPASCSGTVEQVWIILDAFLEKYGVLANVAEKTCICIRRGLSFFDEASFVVAPAVLERMAKNFELSAASSYLWITGKFVENFGRRREAKFEAVLKNVFERMSTKVFGLLQSTTPAQLADGEYDTVSDSSDLADLLIDASPR
jgi:transportin-3